MKPIIFTPEQVAAIVLSFCATEGLIERGAEYNVKLTASGIEVTPLQTTPAPIATRKHLRLVHSRR